MEKTPGFPISWKTPLSKVRKSFVPFSLSIMVLYAIYFELIVVTLYTTVFWWLFGVNGGKGFLGIAAVRVRGSIPLVQNWEM